MHCSSQGPEPGKVSSQEHNHNTKQHFSSKFQRMSLGPRLTVSGLVWAAYYLAPRSGDQALSECELSIPASLAAGILDSAASGRPRSYLITVVYR